MRSIIDNMNKDSRNSNGCQSVSLFAGARKISVINGRCQWSSAPPYPSVSPREEKLETGGSDSSSVQSASWTWRRSPHRMAVAAAWASRSRLQLRKGGSCQKKQRERIPHDGQNFVNGSSAPPHEVWSAVACITNHRTQGMAHDPRNPAQR